MPQPGRPKFDRVSAPEVEHGLVRPLRYVENRGSAQRVADAFRDGKAVILEQEFDPKPWKSQMFSAMTDATSFLVAARYYMKLDPQTKKEFFRPSACGLEPELVELPGKECVHLSKAMVERQEECAARAAFRGFDRLARGLLLTLQAAEPSFQPDVYGDDQGHFTAGAGVYRDKLKPLLDSTDAGHLLSIFSYTGEGACIEHVDRGFITLVTNTDGALQVQDAQSRWLDVPQTNGLVAFAGKTLEFLTQGKYRAVPHRIAPGKASGRVSLAFKLRAPLAAELVLQNGDVTTVGQLFENHVDAVGLSINQPSRTAAVGSSLARPHGQRGPHGGYGEAEAEAAHGAKLASSAGAVTAVTVMPLFQSCELPAFLACRAVCREWLGYSDMSQCWVRFCIQRGIPWLHRQLDWPGYFSDWQKKLYIWRHQPKIRAVPIQSPFAMYSTIQPRPPVCRSQRLSAAIRQWGMAGHCEIKFYRPDDGRKTVDLECLGVWDGVLLRQSHLQENIDEVEFSRHGGTTWDPFLGEMNLSDHILFHIVMRGD